MKKIILIPVILVVVAAGIGAYFVFKPSETDLLFEQCKAKILKQLKAPSTAVFGEYRHTPRHIKTYEFSDSQFDIEEFSVLVDAQNSFSALIRSEWHCSIFYDKNGKIVEFDAYRNTQ